MTPTEAKQLAEKYWRLIDAAKFGPLFQRHELRCDADELAQTLDMAGYDEQGEPIKVK
jgi:hypothetical protein